MTHPRAGEAVGLLLEHDGGAVDPGPLLDGMAPLVGHDHGEHVATAVLVVDRREQGLIVEGHEVAFGAVEGVALDVVEAGLGLAAAGHAPGPLLHRPDAALEIAVRRAVDDGEGRPPVRLDVDDGGAERVVVGLRRALAAGREHRRRVGRGGGGSRRGRRGGRRSGGGRGRGRCDGGGRAGDRPGRHRRAAPGGPDVDRGRAGGQHDRRHQPGDDGTPRASPVAPAGAASHAHGGSHDTRRSGRPHRDFVARPGAAADAWEDCSMVTIRRPGARRHPRRLGIHRQRLLGRGPGVERAWRRRRGAGGG